MVVGVFPLLQLRGHHTVVIGASKQARKRKLVLAVFGFVVASEYGLNSLKEVIVDEGRVSPFVGLPFGVVSESVTMHPEPYLRRTPIDEQLDTGHEAAVVGREEHGRICDLACLTVASGSF